MLSSTNAFTRVPIMFVGDRPGAAHRDARRACDRDRERGRREIASIRAVSLASIVTGPVVTGCQPFATVYVCVARFSVAAGPVYS